MNYRPTIGLEIHAELATKTKMFCDSANDPDETRPNVNVCPVCLAHPGTLPTINREAVRHVLRIGAALGSELATVSEFDRKSYFYPDIPKGYQISQYEHPLVRGGSLAGIAITRVHLEEDTARSIHTHGKSLVDFNRAGIPLMELVTEPEIPDAETAGAFARELQLLLRVLGASEANLEKGEMRIEANVSVAKLQEPNSKNQTRTNNQNSKLGTKVEVKNLNSFRSVERAIAYEIKRQTALIESGGKVVQETRGWDEAKQQTFHQRFKEGSADYRYFPEPDLPKLLLTLIPEFSPEALSESLPELPWERRARYQKMDIAPDHIEMFIADDRLGTVFESTLRLQPGAPRLVANYIGSDIVGLIAAHGDTGLQNITPEGLAAVLELYTTDKISSRGVKDAITDAFVNGGDLKEISKKYLQESSEAALEDVINAVLAEEVKAVAEYRAGKHAALQYLVGKAMRKSGSAGNPTTLRKLFITKLSTKNQIARTKQ